MVIEFKRCVSDSDAQQALQAAIKQMQSKKYGQGAFLDHQLFRVAMVISSEKKSSSARVLQGSAGMI